MKTMQVEPDKSLASLTDYDIQRLRDTLDYVDTGVITGEEAKRRVKEITGGKINSPNSNRRVIGKKIRMALRMIDQLKQVQS